MFENEANPVLIQDVVEKMRFGNFPMTLKLSCKGVVLTIEIRSRDRDTGDPSVVGGQYLVPAWFQKPYHFEPLCLWIIEKVMDLLHHEVLEFMTFNGEHIFDPHKPRPRPSLMTPDQVVNDIMGDLMRAGKGAGQGPKP